MVVVERRGLHAQVAQAAMRYWRKDRLVRETARRGVALDRTLRIDHDRCVLVRGWFAGLVAIAGCVPFACSSSEADPGDVSDAGSPADGGAERAAEPADASGDTGVTCGVAPLGDDFEGASFAAGWSAGLGSYGNGIDLAVSPAQKHTGTQSLAVTVAPADGGGRRGYSLVRQLANLPGCVAADLWLRSDRAPKKDLAFAGITTADSNVLLSLTASGTIRASEQRLYPDGGSEVLGLGTAPPIASGTWSHVVLRYEVTAATATVTLVVDGTSQVVATKAAHGAPNTVAIGAPVVDAAENLVLFIDDVAVR